MSKFKKFVIVGQGIAGSLLALALMKEGHHIIIHDDGHQTSSTKVSAGIFNPITGQRLIPIKQFDVFYATAMASYAQLAQQFGIAIFTPKPLVRILLNEAELIRCQQLGRDSQAGQYIKAIYPSGKYHPVLKDPYGCVEFLNAGYCKAPLLLQTLREYFKNQGVLQEGVFDYRQAGNDKVIYCEGFAARHNPHLSYLTFNHVKGEILTLRVDGGLLPEVILNQHVWCVPQGDNIFLAGSTYDRENLDLKPTLAGERIIIDGIKNFINAPITVLNHHAGVRPVMLDTMPVLGDLDHLPNSAIFNGFGSKGFLMVPYYAGMFVDYLIRGKAIPRAVHVNRFKRI